MTPSTPKLQRCAIYTRKSTEHNLDLAFNSLDAQREACEAYIRSQAHEGWRLVPIRFDDGGLSGASLDRSALQDLLEQVRAGKIDVVVVYKVDRLTRSLADFAKLVELFDAHAVSFVSVTQSFNTTSSMGRLTLNVLLSFAQFEREVIGERVRDKIAASKRKGMWVGGPVPLGYRSVGKKLEIVAEEAAPVRQIFADYLRVGSVGELAATLERQGIRPKSRILAEGRTTAAERFMVGPLAHLLKNRFYIGEIVYRGETHKGEHEPILDKTLFDAVQARLAEQAVQRTIGRSESPAILTGLIFDDCANPMSPSHANKNGVRYRYYVSQAVLQNRKAEAGSVSRVSAPDVESMICKSVREAVGAEAEVSERDLIRQHVERIVVQPGRIAISLRPAEPATAEPKSHCGEDSELDIPFAPRVSARKGVVHAPSGRRTIDGKTRGTLLQAIARSRGWIDAILGGKFASFDNIAAAEGLVERHVRRLAPLAFLSPKIVQAIADGTAPAGLTVSRLTDALPTAWADQEQLIGRI
jgi:site-specific DNA recombinase